MREDNVKRDYYWIVEAVARSGEVIFHKEYEDFDDAWNKYYSFKGKATVSLQRKFREFKVA